MEKKTKQNNPKQKLDLGDRRPGFCFQFCCGLVGGSGRVPFPLWLSIFSSVKCKR